MATIVNDRDVLLQATVPRYATPIDRAMILSASAPVFQVTSGGVGSPSAVTFTPTLLNISGTVIYTMSAGIALTYAGNVATLTFANMTAVSGSVTASITVDSVTYTQTQTISKVVDGAAGASGATGGTGATGAVGATGSAGSAGANGAAGANGTNGAAGSAGATGAAGTTGSAGATGAAGSTGANGATGSTGANGASGANGINGTNGSFDPAVRAVLNGSGGVVAGSLAWDASGTRSGGTGIAITSKGIVAHNGSAYTLTVDATTGSAVFGGALSAATGTFSGTLTATDAVITDNIIANGISSVDIFGAIPDKQIFSVSRQSKVLLVCSCTSYGTSPIGGFIVLDSAQTYIGGAQFSSSSPATQSITVAMDLNPGTYYVSRMRYTNNTPQPSPLNAAYILKVMK